MATSNHTKLSSLDRLEISVQAWSQQSIWYKFGCTSVHHTSLQDLTQDTSDLIYSVEAVAQYLYNVNLRIDEAVGRLDEEGARRYAARVPVEEGFPRGCTDKELLAQYYRLQVANRTWLQLAVWNRFGSKSAEPASLQELAFATTKLVTLSTDAAKFIISGNQMIDAWTRPMTGGGEGSTGSSAMTTSPSRTLCSDKPFHSAATGGGTNEEDSALRMGVAAEPQHKSQSSFYFEKAGAGEREDKVGSGEGRRNKEEVDKEVDEEEEEEMDVMEEGDDEDEVVIMSSNVTPYVQVQKQKRIKKEPRELSNERYIMKRMHRHWSKTEETRLMQMVNNSVVDWNSISNEMGRSVDSCSSKYYKMHRANEEEF